MALFINGTKVVIFTVQIFQGEARLIDKRENQVKSLMSCYEPGSCLLIVMKKIEIHVNLLFNPISTV